MTSSDPRRAALAALAALLGLLAPSANSSDPSLTVFAASDQVYRGTTETLGRPAVGVAGEWSVSDDFFVGVQARQSRDHDDTPMPRQSAVSIHGGRSWAAGDRHVLTTAATRRFFPGAQGRWDHTELSVDIAASEGFGATLSWSPDYYNRGAAAATGEIAYRQQFRADSYGYTAAGAVRFAGSARPGHLYGRLGIGRSWRSLNAELEAYWNSEGRDERLGGERFSDPGLRLLLAWRIY